MKSKIIKQWIRIVLGLLIFSFGTHLTIFANIGLAPWDCLGMAISYHTPLNYGISMTVIAVIIVCIDLLLKERIGFGTIFDALLVGNMIQMFNDINPLPLNNGYLTGIPIMIAGFFIMAIGQFFYMGAGQFAGPRDMLFVAIGRRMPKTPIGLVNILLQAVVVLVSWMLGGPVGIGTLISAVGEGSVMQLVYRIVRFEPRKVQNKSVIEVIKILKE